MGVLKVIRRSPLVSMFAALAAVAMLFVSEGTYWQSIGTLDRLGVMQESRTSIQRLSQGVVDAETAQRGYFLTGRKEYLQPYDRALTVIAASFRFLDAYYGGDPSAVALLSRLHRVTEIRLSELAETIRLHDAGKADIANELILTNIGKDRMDEIQTLGAELLAYETAKVTAGRSEVYRTLMLSRAGMAALSAIGLLALFLFLRHADAAVAHQRELKRIVQAERDRLEDEVAQRTAQLTELAQHLQTAREDERQRLARNLHDELGSLLTSAKLDAARIRSRLAGSSPEALERLAHLVDTLNASIALGRRIIDDLRPSTLDNLGLVATLEILVREFGQSSGVHVHCDLLPVDLAPAAELVAYRAVQESITNITKYAKARQVWVTLAMRGHKVQVTVRDDGVGFDPAATRPSAYGLVGMRYRVQAEGGSLTVESSPQQGTQITVTLPAVGLPAAA